MAKERVVKSLKEILEMDTSGMSLSEMINMLPDEGTPAEFAHNILQLRLKHEDDTGIPMEEDEIGEQESERIDEVFGDITNRL
jgi:hypothetical protein